MSKIHYPHQTYLELAITLQFHRTEQEPLMISNHLLVREEKSTNMGLVRPLVVKILFVVHLLDFTLQNQPIPNADVPILRPVNVRPILEDSIILPPQRAILAHLLESYHVLPHQQVPANLNDPLPVHRVQLIHLMSHANAADNCIPRCLWH
jgi:hypothetical protein